ncbi:MAG: hypothetical protein ACRDN9_01010 [Streptosporangiaceae bacterium]
MRLGRPDDDPALRAYAGALIGGMMALTLPFFVEQSAPGWLAELDTAIAWLRSRDDRECSFVDATSFALMREREIDRALAFDGDFSAAGFAELR